MALITGTLLAVGAVAWVLQPLFAQNKGEKICERCGPRPEADAVFCSSCGARLGSG